MLQAFSFLVMVRDHSVLCAGAQASPKPSLKVGVNIGRLLKGSNFHGWYCSNGLIYGMPSYSEP